MTASKRLVGLILLAFCTVDAWAQQDAAQAPEPFSTTRLSEHLYVVHGGAGYGSHVGVCVGDNGLLLIDSMLPTSSKRLAAVLESISDKPVRFIINTHHHSDHTGGNLYFAAKGAVSIAHPSSRFSPVEGDLKVQNADLEFCGEAISIRPLIAHTYDDLVVHFKGSDVLFLGDAFANNWHPTGYTRGLSSEMESVSLALSMSDDDTVVVPGHGFLDSTRGLERYLLLNENWYARLEALADAGLSPEEMALDQELLELRDQFIARRDPASMPPNRFLRFIRQSLAAQLPVRSRVSRTALLEYEGSYSVPDGEPIEVIANADHLIARQEGAFQAELVPVGTDRFEIRGSPRSEVVFARGRCALPSSINLLDGSFTLRGERSLDCL